MFPQSVQPREYRTSLPKNKKHNTDPIYFYLGFFHENKAYLQLQGNMSAIMEPKHEQNFFHYKLSISWNSSLKKQNKPADGGKQKQKRR